MITDNTPLHKATLAGKFKLLSQEKILLELREIINGINCRCQFQANHASNYLDINCRLPTQKKETLAQIEFALENKESLKPEYLRAL